MLSILGLDAAYRNVVFGLAIVLGMLISGDRIADVIGRLILRSSARTRSGRDEPARRLQTVHLTTIRSTKEGQHT